MASYNPSTSKAQQMIHIPSTCPATETRHVGNSWSQETGRAEEWWRMLSTSTFGLHMYAHKGACSSTHVCTCICAKTCIHKCKIHTQEKWKKKTSKALYPEAWADSSPRSLKLSSLWWNCSSDDAVIMTSQSACNRVLPDSGPPKDPRGGHICFLKWQVSGHTVTLQQKMNPGQQEWASQLITGTMG